METRQKIAVCAAIAAFTVGPTAANTLWVTKDMDSGLGSLRATLAEAEDGDTILFDLRRRENEIALKTPLVIGINRFKNKGLTIGGDNGGRCVAIKGDKTFQLLTVQAGNKVNLDGIAFEGGKDGFGGAIGNFGAVTVRNCVFVGNESPSWGGAICNVRATSCYVQNCDFIGNVCGAWGGAVASHTTPLTTVLGCRFRDNTCQNWGGAVAAYSTGDTLVIDCEIHGNGAYGGGGVVVQDGARVTVIGSSVCGNRATAGYGNDLFNLGGTINTIGAFCQSNYGTIEGTTDLPVLRKSYSSLLSANAKTIGGWYSQETNAAGIVSMQLNERARPRFASKSAGQGAIEVADEEYVTMKVDNVKPYLYYGLGWADAPGGEFAVEPGLWVQADGDGNLPSDVKAPKGNGSSRFFRVKVTDDPSVAQ